MKNVYVKKKIRRFFSLKHKGQSMIEFTFSLVVFSLMIYAAAKFAFWLGPDLASRSVVYDELMDGRINPSYDFPLTKFHTVNSGHSLFPLTSGLVHSSKMLNRY